MARFERSVKGVQAEFDALGRSSWEVLVLKGKWLLVLEPSGS